MVCSPIPKRNTNGYTYIFNSKNNNYYCSTLESRLYTVTKPPWLDTHLKKTHNSARIKHILVKLGPKFSELKSQQNKACCGKTTSVARGSLSSQFLSCKAYVCQFKQN